MPKWKISLLVVMLAAASVAQNSSGIMSPDVRRVGGKLACLCGACKNTVGDCPMLECSYCSPLRHKIAALQAAGKSDAGVVEAIVAETGNQALAAPPTEGFALAAWTMPVVAIGFGLAIVWLFIRRISRRPAAAVTSVDPRVLQQYHDRIEKDMAKLE